MPGSTTTSSSAINTAGGVQVGSMDISKGASIALVSGQNSTAPVYTTTAPVEPTTHHLVVASVTPVVPKKTTHHWFLV